MPPEKAKAFISTLLTQHYDIENIDENSGLGYSISSNESHYLSFPTFMFTNLGRTPEEELLKLDFVRSVVETVPGRAMFRTAEGSYGIGPAIVEFGDHVSVLLGCNTPIIPRPSWQQMIVIV